MSYLPPYIYFMAACFLVSLSVYGASGRMYPWLRIFPPFLISTVAAETIGVSLSLRGFNNSAIYNYFTAIEFVVYLFIIRAIVTSKRAKAVIIYTMILYVITTLINILFVIPAGYFHSITYSLGCLIIVTFCIYYFLELFRNPKSVKLTNVPAFWICSGLLFFYCCGFPLYGLINYFDNGFGTLVIRNFINILTILNIFLYSLFTIAFVCIKTRKYTLSPS